jgi:hypothetical protein
MFGVLAGSDRAFRGPHRGCWIRTALSRFQPHEFETSYTYRHAHAWAVAGGSNSSKIQARFSCCTISYLRLVIEHPFGPFMKSPLESLRTHLNCAELVQNSTEHAYDVIDWFHHPSGKLFGCIGMVEREAFFESERRRGQCSFTRTKNRPSSGQDLNETWLCHRSKERHASRQAKQRLGHAPAAIQVKQRRSTQNKAKKQDGTNCS